MLPFSEILIFALAAFILVISPGPNMIYLISRSVCQGKKAGFISLLGVVCGFLFHILLLAFGLSAILFAIPFVFLTLKYLGIAYLLWLAWNAVKPGSKSVFDTRNLPDDAPFTLFQMGFLTNVLNPKVAVFYASLFPQFIEPELGGVFGQTLQLGLVQMGVSFSVNFLIVMTAGQVAGFLATHPTWVTIQKWFMGGVLVALAAKLSLDK